MKKEARYKLNAKSQKSRFLTTAKISRIFKTDFLTIYHTSASFLCQHFCSEKGYTFIAFLVHFDSIPGTPLSILNEQVFLAKSSFDLKLRFPRSLLYRKTIAHLHFIQTNQFAKAISVTKHLHFVKKAFIMNSILRLSLSLITVTITVYRVQRKEEHYAYSSNKRNRRFPSRKNGSGT